MRHQGLSATPERRRRTCPETTPRGARRIIRPGCGRLTPRHPEVLVDDPGFDYRFVADELRTAGHRVGERRVWRLCSQAGIFSAHSRKRGEAGRPGPPVHDDRVERDFTAAAPNRLWLTDITEHPTAEGKRHTSARSQTSAPAGSSATPSAMG